MIAAGIQGRFQKLEMDRGHLGAQDRIILAHFLGEYHTLDVGRTDGTLLGIFFPHAHGGQQGADADAGGAQVVYLVDLQAGVDLAGIAQNIVDRIGGHGIQAAAEGVQLDEIQIFPQLHIVGCRIQARVVHPLVHDDQRPLHRV